MPDRLLVLVLGASTFSDRRRFSSKRSFRLSADGLLLELANSGIEPEDVLNLFDSPLSAHHQLKEVAAFLNARDQAAALLVYYVGHGAFTRADRHFFLALRESWFDFAEQTGLLITSLARVVREEFPAGKRTFVMLDCCYSAKAASAFQAPVPQIIEEQTFHAFGTALLCAASADDVGLAPDNDAPTLFSAALISALRYGIADAGPSLTFRSLKDEMRRTIRAAHGPDAPMPEVHSPRQIVGDVADAPFLPNPAHAKQPVEPPVRAAPRFESPRMGHWIGSTVAIILLVGGAVVWIQREPPRLSETTTDTVTNNVVTTIVGFDAVAQGHERSPPAVHFNDRVVTVDSAPGYRSLNDPTMPKLSGSSGPHKALHLGNVIDWLRVDSNKRYRRDGSTFPNIYAHDYSLAAGAYLPRVWWTPGAIRDIANGETVVARLDSTVQEMRANDLCRWLEAYGHSFEWRKISDLTMLQTAANRGAVALICATRAEENRAGHIALVVPETNRHKAVRTRGQVLQPLQSQAGVNNFRYGMSNGRWWEDASFSTAGFWLNEEPNTAFIRWFMESFGTQASAAVKDTPFTVELLAAVALIQSGWLYRGTRIDDPKFFLSICVGDTMDADRGRRAFPKNKDELLSSPRGREMFQESRLALQRLAFVKPSYAAAIANPDKFVRSFGIFPADLQDFKTDPDYFLSSAWQDFEQSAGRYVKTLNAALERMKRADFKRLTDIQLVEVAIAAETGRFEPQKGLRQGFQSDDGFYGERLYNFLLLAKTLVPQAETALAASAAR